jgi:fermentation-respiration switch protein FrsA (DUF1100 family)
MTSALVHLLAIFGLLAGGLYLLQPSMVFLPSPDIEETPSNWGLAYEDLWLRTGDGVRLHAWYLARPGARQVLLFFHGNAGNISHRRASLEIFHWLGLDVLILDYRGYGRSAGRPTEAGLYLDAAAAWDYLVKTRGVAPSDIVVFGRSLGGAVAARLAADARPGALILESTFSPRFQRESLSSSLQVYEMFVDWLISAAFSSQCTHVKDVSMLVKMR